jgi:DNA polymerase epsilon subunit 2
LLQVEKQDDANIVVLSDVWLDQPVVFEKLRILFQGYSQAIVPIMFLFIGNFQSTPFLSNSNASKVYRGIILLKKIVSINWVY